MKRSVLCTVGVVLILGVAVTALYSARMGKGEIVAGSPEGYEESMDEGQEFVRIEKLDIKDTVTRYENILELVAFTPGSGWLRFKTGSGISPLLSFNRVSRKDIQGFNRFSENLGLPIRAELHGNMLRLTADDDDESIIVSDNANGAKSTMQRGFYEPEKPPQLAISRYQNGSVFLVEAQDEKKKADAFVAQITHKEATAK
jgi:hypothetical protein